MIKTVNELQKRIKAAKPGVEQVALTADIATHLLSLSKGNRQLRTTKVQKYYHSMMNDSFYGGNDMLCLSEEEDLSNGHHRCTAASLLPKDKLVSVYIRFCVPKIELSTFDTGANRNYDDYKAMKGEKRSDNWFLSPNTIRAVAKLILSEGRQYGEAYDHIIIEEFERRYAKDIKYVAKYFEKRIPRIAVAPCLAVLLQAKIYHTENKLDFTKLEQAISFISKGMENLDDLSPFDGRETLTAIVRYLMADSTKTSDAASFSEVYFKVMNSIQNFLSDKIALRATIAKKNCFPVKLDWMDDYLIADHERVPFVLGTETYKKFVQNRDKLDGKELSIAEISVLLDITKEFAAKFNRLLESNIEIDFKAKKTAKGIYSFY